MQTDDNVAIWRLYTFHSSLFSFIMVQASWLVQYHYIVFSSITYTYILSRTQEVKFIWFPCQLVVLGAKRQRHTFGNICDNKTA